MSETNNFVLTVRSGGQTGADRAALDAALHYNSTKNLSNGEKKSLIVNVTGWCPKGRLAEDGTISPRYPLNETPSSSYAERTEWNIRDGDATLVLLLSATTPPDFGTSFTIEKANEFKKPSRIIFLDDDIMHNARQVINWMNVNQVNALNVAGPRESNCPGLYNKAKKFMIALLDEINKSGKLSLK
nr:10999_t:CDS:2 [Entrophospora candida]